MHTAVRVRASFSIILGVFLVAALGLSLLIVTQKPGHAQATCSTLPSEFGLATQTVTLTETRDYDIWSRVKSSDGAPSYTLSVDGDAGSLCDETVDTTAPADTWVWVKAANTFSSTAGDVTVQMSGVKAGVGLDCVVFTVVSSFSPTDASDCEPPPDTAEPIVAMTAPADGATLNGNVTLTATASDNDAVESVQFYVDGSPVGDPDTTMPYEYVWDTDTFSDGDHTIYATATDVSGNEGTSTSITVTSDNAPVPPSADDLLARWRFDETSGVSAADSSGNSNTGTVNGAQWAAGNTGNALNFDGNNDYVDLNGLDISSDEVSFSAWINANSFNNYPRIISKTTSSQNNDHYWMLSTAPSGGEKLRFRLKTSGTTTVLIADSGNLSTNTWHHVAATYDGEMMRLYVDGNEVGSTAASEVIDSNPTVPVYIGANPDSSAHFDGLIDDVQIYTKGLSGLEVKALSESMEPTSSGGGGDPDPGPDPDPGDIVPPRVDIINDTNDRAVNDTYKIDVDASDETALDRVEFYVNGNLVQTDTTPPYSFDFGIRDPSITNGNYTIQSRAFDTSGNQANSSEKTLKVRHPDVNRNGSVDIFDLSIMLSSWSNDDANVDLNDNGAVDIFDLSILLSQWGN